jgi:hypothetical protein
MITRGRTAMNASLPFAGSVSGPDRGYEEGARAKGRGRPIVRTPDPTVDNR